MLHYIMSYHIVFPPRPGCPQPPEKIITMAAAAWLISYKYSMVRRLRAILVSNIVLLSITLCISVFIVMYYTSIICYLLVTAS